MRKKKKQESEEIAKRLRSYHKEVASLEKEEKEVLAKMKKTQVVYRSLRYAIDKLAKMK